jgi:hypothetical protein
LVNVIADQSHRELVTHEDEHVMGNIYAGPGKTLTLKPWKPQYMHFVDIETKAFIKKAMIGLHQQI